MALYATNRLRSWWFCPAVFGLAVLFMALCAGTAPAFDILATPAGETGRFYPPYSALRLVDQDPSLPGSGDCDEPMLRLVISGLLQDTCKILEQEATFTPLLLLEKEGLALVLRFTY